MISRRVCPSSAAFRCDRGTGVLALAVVSLGLSLLLSTAWAGMAAAEAAPAAPALPEIAAADGPPLLLAQEGGTEPRELEPRYQPPEPGEPGPYNEQERDWYNSDYLFGMTRGVAGSTIAPAGKVPLFLFTIPLDIVLFPFALIGGFFG